jgi:hypothetical protein
MRRLPTRERLAQTDTWLLELFQGLYLLVWGLGFLNPLTDTFAANPRSYTLLGRFPGGEPAFGGATVLLGLLTLAGVLYGTRPERSLVMGLCAAVLAGGRGPDRHPDIAWAAGGIPHFLLATVACGFCAWRMRRGRRCERRPDRPDRDGGRGAARRRVRAQPARLVAGPRQVPPRRRSPRRSACSPTTSRPASG